MRRVLLAVALGLGALLLVVLVRAASLTSTQPDVEPAPPFEVDTESVARRLARGLRLRTISYQDPSLLPADEFDALARLLEETFPRVHTTLVREIVNRHSYLYTWEGSDPSLEPGLLMAHLDVVPVEPGTEERWEHPPFGGEVADGFVWGRGAMDDKGSVFCILEAVEALLAQGHQPARTFYLAFGHDEEIGGDEGAVRIAELLESRGVRLAFVVDEGGIVAEDVVSLIDVPVATIGISEKGSVSVELSVEVAGGHSSTPPGTTAIGILARALYRIETHPMPARLDGPTRTFLESLAPEVSLPVRAVLGNLWLFEPVVLRFFERSPPTNAMIRTSTAVTIVEGGVKENVLPARARAVVNHRILPGDTVEDVALHLRRVVDDDRVKLEVGLSSPPRNPSPLSPVDTRAYEVLERSIREVFPGAAVLPYLVIGGTDARHYHGVSDNVYRFGPYVYDASDLTRPHGTNERVSVENLGRAVQFYARFIRNTSEDVLGE